MKNIPPPTKPGVSSDSQCNAPGLQCGAPSIIDNQNLEKSVGGNPGFITISRHMCVGDSIDSGEFTKATYGSVLGKTTTTNYPYACGFFDYTRSITGDSRTSSSSPSTLLWRAGVGACSQWFDFFCHIFYGCFKDNDPKTALKRNNVSETMTVNYLTNPSQPKRKKILQNTNKPLSSERINVNFEGIIPIIKRAARFSTPGIEDVFVHSIVRHPRMNREELRFFGVRESEFDNVLVAAPGSEVDINFSCIHSEALSVSVVFFKWDLSTIVGHNGRVTINGRAADLYKIKSEKIDAGQTHTVDKMMEYILYSGWFRNGANRGNTGQGYTGKVTMPFEPFYNDDTIMVVFVGNKFPALGRYSNSRRFYQVPNLGAVSASSQGWNQPTPYASTGLPWSRNGGGDNILCGCSLTVKVGEYTEPNRGCSQTRNVDWELYSDPQGSSFRRASGTDQNWKATSQGSHIIKIVSDDYYTRECTYRMSPSIENNSDLLQNSVVYAANCFQDVGDPYVNSESILAKESRLGSFYTEKCASYSMNISPNAEISNVSRCCIPKITGPFILEKNPYGEDPKPFKNDTLSDGPDIENNYRPNLNFYNKNLSYLLENRIDCECDSSECARTKCYTCPSNSKIEYEACLASDLCGGSPDKADCCVNPCEGAPQEYGACVRANGGLYNKAGCCSECDDCVANNMNEYQQCLDNGGIFGELNCNNRGCCSINCEGCPEDIVQCSNIRACEGCCELVCRANCDLKDEYGPVSQGGHPTLNADRVRDGEEVWPPIYVNKTLNDYWNCVAKTKNFINYPKNLCKEKCCCANPCDKYRTENGPLSISARDPRDGSTTTRSWMKSDCRNDPTCLSEGCIPYLPG